jgi:hypothetical protein
MRLLIEDLVRRNRWRAAALCVFLLLMFGATAAMGDFTRAFGVSMSVAFAGGTLTLQYVPRAIWYLPISKRDIWRAHWLVATVGVTLLTTAVKLAVLLVPQVRASSGLAVIALSSLCDFAYVGVGCGLVILATRPQPASGPRRGAAALFKAVAEIGLTSGFLLAAYGSFMLSHVLPTRWSELTPRSATLLIAALGVAVATYFHSPVPLTPSNRVTRRPRVKAGAPRFDLGGLSGLPRLLVHESAWTLMVGGSLLVGSALFVLVVANVAESPGGLAGFLRSLLQRLDTRVNPDPTGGFDAFIQLIAFALFAATLAARFPSMMRHLRVLPLGATRLNALLLAWPAAVWLTAWIALQVLHYAILGRSAAFHHADALLGLIGIGALLQAMSLRLPALIRPLAFVPLLVVVPMSLFMDAPSAAACVAIGLGGLAIAAALNHRSLARRSTYTPSGPAIGGVQLF